MSIDPQTPNSTRVAVLDIAMARLVFDWTDKWLELIKLINETTGTDEPPGPLGTTVDRLLIDVTIWLHKRL